VKAATIGIRTLANYFVGLKDRQDRESVLMMRCLVRIRSKFQWHDPDVLRYTISGVLSKNSGIMLPKFHPDPNQVSHHNHALSVTLRWV
jgi:hypothetical protein